jgi:hypothetical protein
VTEEFAAKTCEVKKKLSKFLSPVLLYHPSVSTALDSACAWVTSQPGAERHENVQIENIIDSIRFCFSFKRLGPDFQNFLWALADTPPKISFPPTCWTNRFL